VRQRLTHTSGSRRNIPDPEAQGDPDSAALMARVLREDSPPPARSRVIYSDLNAILLCELVGRVGGRTTRTAFVARESSRLGLHEMIVPAAAPPASPDRSHGVWHAIPSPAS